MNETGVMVEVIALLEKGHIEQADLELRRCLGHMKPEKPYFNVMSTAAQLIHPFGEPKKAMAELKRAIETMEQGSKHEP